MNQKKHSKARSIVAWIFGIYAAIVVLFNLPFMQSAAARWTANVLSRQLSTRVEIGSINLGFLNNIILNDIYIEDQQQKHLLKVARMSASINLLSLITNGNINISTAQLFGTHANLYRSTPESTPNYQFVIDAFSSSDKESKPINLRIHSLIVRHANIKYDVHSMPATNVINPNHIDIRNAGFNLSLNHFSPDSLNMSLRRLQAEEKNSGLNIHDFSLGIIANDHTADVSQLSLSLPSSTLKFDSLHIDYPHFTDDHSFRFSPTNIDAVVTPSDLAFLSPSIADIHESINISTTISGDNNDLDVKRLLINNETNTIDTDITANISRYSTSTPSFNIAVNNLFLAEGEPHKWVSRFVSDDESLTPLYNLGDIKYTGNIHSAQQRYLSDGDITTDAGNLSYTASFDELKTLTADIETADIDLQRILADEHLGKVSLTANTTIDLSQKHNIPVGSLTATIQSLDYLGYNYSDINLTANSNASDINISAASADPNAHLDLDAKISSITPSRYSIASNLNVHSLNPYNLHISDAKANQTYKFNLTTDMAVSSLSDLNGHLSLTDIVLNYNDTVSTIEHIDIDANLDGSDHQHLTVDSDPLTAQINGKFRIQDLANDFKNIIAHHLPSLINHKYEPSTSNFQYQLTFYDSPILHQFINADYIVHSPVNIQGMLDSPYNSLSIQCQAPRLSFNDHVFENVNLNCNSSRGNMMLTLTGLTDTDDSHYDGKIIAIAHGDKIDTDIQIHNKGKENINASLFSTTSFSRSAGNLTTNLRFEESTVSINDDFWLIKPSQLSYSNEALECNGFRISNGRQYLEIDGKASTNPSDSLVLHLNDVEVAYILDLANFTSVDFGGKASGTAIINNLFGTPDAHANLFVRDFSLQKGIMGDANILASWDKELEGISVNAHIVDQYDSQIRLTGKKMQFQGVTEVNGHILPKQKELELHVLTSNTRADFLNGFLGGVCDNIDGRINGLVNVVGPFNDINIIGRPTADISLVLHSTGVPYCINGDTIRLDYHAMNFEDIIIRDRQNNIGVLNGKLTHRNLANFTYKFDVDMTNLCAYNETEFNSDKFLAQVWANGDILVNGSDGHPLTIEANVSPCKGSVFAYDSATPDALVSNTFIDFHDITPSAVTSPSISAVPSAHTESTATVDTPSDIEEDVATSLIDQNTTYYGDIYMDVNIDLNPNCEIKLRMDNTPDGYISTFGNGTIQAKYHNKGAFQLFGNYNITSGRYRLYLQDLVYRNLAIQDGSKVEFNGNPFDANLHLICKHEITSVPLSDLTTTTAFSSNNKVKVDCFLDITGHLDNMELSFNFELPNVSEETRQLVRSMINSDEEMNKQMIYLLGFQRFYPNELAQSNIEDYGTQAVNSLISSTISGQINQMLSNMIGSRSKWNFGTGITTGENGWQDLDVEGILSGRLLNDRLLINGNFGYRDNSLTNQANFIGDFEVKYRIWESGDFFVKAYNQTNDRYFTKATLNTQGVGLSFQHDFERYTLFPRRKPAIKPSTQSTTAEGSQPSAPASASAEATDSIPSTNGK